MKGTKIVIVDDDSVVTDTLKIMLDLEGFLNVQFFNDPKLALKFLENNKPDLVMSDFMMPEMNGIEFLTQVKKMYPKLSLILLTGYADKENAIRAINDVGLYKYIEKPWDNDDLILNIKNAIERTRLGDELEIKNKELEKHVNNLEELVTQKTLEIVKSNNKLNAIVNNCADAVIVADKFKTVLSTNPASYNLFGMGDVVGKNLFELIINEKNVDVSLAFKENVKSRLEGFSVIDYQNERKRPVDIRITPLDNVDFGQDKFLVLIRDISLEKEAERLRDDFIATLTHDLRTPLLASIQTLAFFLDGTLGPMGEKQTLLLDTMKKSNEDMLGLVNALLEVYKYESGHLVLCKTKFNVYELAKNCINELNSLAQNKEIEIYLEGPSDLEINADKTELRRVFSNLIGNAIKYSFDKTKVKVILEAEGENLTLRVKDQGMGIKEEDAQKLFKRFSQGTSAKRSVSTGLGLYLSRQIIEAHKGKIWAQGIENGSEFCFTLKNVILLKAANNG